MIKILVLRISILTLIRISGCVLSHRDLCQFDKALRLLISLGGKIFGTLWYYNQALRRFSGLSGYGLYADIKIFFLA